MTLETLTQNSPTGTLSGKTAIVTGGSRGIGRAICTALAAEGARVLVNYSKPAEQAAALAERIGGVAFQADVADATQVRSLFDAAEGAFQSVDIRVNNAGIALLKPVAATEIDEYDRVFAVNARGAADCGSKAAIEQLTRAWARELGAMELS